VDEVYKYLGPYAHKRFDDIGTLAQAIYRTKAREKTSGTARDILAAFDDSSALSKLYGIGRRAAAAESITSSVGLPGAGAVGVIVRGVDRTRKPVAADELLASPSFRNAIQELSDVNRSNSLVTVALPKKLVHSLARIFPNIRLWEIQHGTKTIHR